MSRGVSDVRRRLPSKHAARVSLCVLLALLVVPAFGVVVAAPPTLKVNFSYSPSAPLVGDLVTFTSRATPGTAGIVREDWDFNGDGVADATGSTVTWTFTAPGTYNVTLQVEDSAGTIMSKTRAVTVTDVVTPPPSPPPPVPPPAPPPVPPPAPPPAPAPVPPPVAPPPVAPPVAPPPVAPPVAPPPVAPPAVAPPAITPPPPAPLAAPVIPSSTGVAAEPTSPNAISPFPVVRISGGYSTRGVRLRVFTVTAPPGARIRIRCSGLGCPYRARGPLRVLRSAPLADGGVSRLIRIAGFRGRLLRPGARLLVYVAHPNQIGKFTRFTIRRSGPPNRADRCLRTSGKIFACV